MRTDGVPVNLLLFQSLTNFIHPALPVSFRRDTKSRWLILPGVYARGHEVSHAGGKRVNCVHSQSGGLYLYPSSAMNAPSLTIL